MNDTTARLALPLIVPGQAQKDMTHNEAIALLAIATQASVLAVGTTSPPSDPPLGACWIIGSDPTGSWTGKAKCVAGWTEGGWRFLPPHAGFTVFVETIGRRATYKNEAWRIEASGPAIPPPTGGDVVDTQARNAINQVLSVLRSLDLVPE